MSNPAESFEPYRRRLLGLAYRMLGSMADAEDAVQEAYLRWHGADRGNVSHPVDVTGGASRLFGRFPDGGRANVDLDWTYEFLTEPFEISRGVVFGPGAYAFSQATAGYNSDRSRWLSGGVGITSGDFWSGEIAGVELASRVRMNEHVAISAALERNHVELPEGDFRTTPARVRLDSSISTRMFLNALVQYNSTTRAWLTNVRFNLMHRPLSDVFIVLNDTRMPSGVSTRSIAFKFTHLLSF